MIITKIRKRIQRYASEKLGIGISRMLDHERLSKASFAAGLTAAFIILAVVLASLPDQDGVNMLAGRATTSRVLVLNIENATCNTTLNAGWNLVSFICMNNDNSMGTYLSGINSSVISVHTYHAFESLDKWKAYNPNLPSWVINDLASIDRAEGYWINMNGSRVLVGNGSMIKPTPIAIKKGWNLVGYPTNIQRNITVSLATNLGPDWSAVYMYNSSDAFDPWKVFMQNPPAFVTLDLFNFSTGFGYWVNSSKTGEWYVNY